MFSEVSTKKKSFHTCFPSATDRQTDKQTDRARAFSSTRSSAQGNCSAKSLAGHVVDSSLSSLSSTSHVGRLQGGGGSTRGEGGPAGGSGGGGGGGWGGEGVGGGGGGRGHFIHLAIHCTTTWCFALKGLRTITRRSAQVTSWTCWTPSRAISASPTRSYSTLTARSARRTATPGPASSGTSRTG